VGQVLPGERGGFGVFPQERDQVRWPGPVIGHREAKQAALGIIGKAKEVQGCLDVDPLAGADAFAKDMPPVPSPSQVADHMPGDAKPVADDGPEGNPQADDDNPHRHRHLRIVEDDGDEDRQAPQHEHSNPGERAQHDGSLSGDTSVG
jgi:hypothetical protein